MAPRHGRSTALAVTALQFAVPTLATLRRWPPVVPSQFRAGPIVAALTSESFSAMLASRPIRRQRIPVLTARTTAAFVSHIISSIAIAMATTALVGAIGGFASLRPALSAQLRTITVSWVSGTP
ncbi:MAG: hypothetical protein IT581_16665 [Verrucomicrobiales bacterium]|nr:hypothetical protein [Verrucomicrobiales bacterium]